MKMAAVRVFLKEEIKRAATRMNIDDVRGYLSVLADKYDLAEEIPESQLKILPLTIFSGSLQVFFPRASKTMAGRDIDEIELPAHVMKLKVTVLSNGRDFTASRVTVYRTAKLPKRLKVCFPRVAYTVCF